VAFTDAGEAYVARGRQLIPAFEGHERETSSRDDTLRGTLRVSAPTVYGSVKVAPLFVALARKHPTLDVHLKCEDRPRGKLRFRCAEPVRTINPGRVIKHTSGVSISGTTRKRSRSW